MAAWEKVRDAKLAKRESLIPAEYRLPTGHPIWAARKANASDIAVLEASGLLTAEDKRITAMSASEIARDVAAGRIDAETVCRAFVKRAAYAHQLSNLLTEICFVDALERARHLDRTFKSTGKTVGPLHGVPISIKDNFSVKGLDASVGFLSPPFVNSPAKEDSVAVKILRDAGAIIYCKTNIPQLMMSAEPVNPLWGRSTNPHSRGLITGGSSSGEGGLVAARGSPLGLGTDIGGSVRGPAAFNGVYGLKPTSLRIPLLGGMTLIGGQESVRSVGGPLGSSVEDLDLMMRTILAARPYQLDPMVLNVGWREEEKEQVRGKKLVVGYFVDNGLYLTSPPNKRAILATVAALRAQGHRCVEIQPPKVARLQAISSEVFFSHGYVRLAEHADRTGDPLERFTSYQASFAKMSREQIAARAEGALKKYPDDAAFRELVLAGARGPLSSDELFRTNLERNAIAKEWLDMWAKQGLDVVISEALALPALPPWKMNTEAPFMGVGTVIYNVLDFPGGIIPVTAVDPAVDGPSSHRGRWKGESDIHRVWNENREAMAGAPVSVQVAARRMEDEKLVECMKEIDRCLKEAEKAAKGKL
ncbi:amidase signature domain-containing protein [Hyaloraphidium curvatum]|nr:amidase signature domain-containing protein [Hyaloraphidium curvatum]